MKTVDSNKQKLTTPEIVVESVKQLNNLQDEVDLPLETALLAIAEEGSMESADTVQIGNTVFLAHSGKGENKNKMWGRAFNIDTGRNFISNAMEYLRYLQNKNVTHYTTEFETDTLVPAMQMIQKRLKKTSDSAMYIGVTEDDEYIVYVKLGKDSIR
jgi:hypothetical protein